MKLVLKSAAVALTLFISACASIVSDSTYPVAINTSPEGAKFTIKNKAGFKMQTGRTPALLNLSADRGFFKGETYTVTLEKEGFEAKTMIIDSKLDGWYIGNLLFGGLIGLLIVDPASGAMWKLPENNLVSLDEVVASTSEERTLNVVTIDQVPADQVAQLVRIK